jgi:uncharacterized protein (DUF1684 family)
MSNLLQAAQLTSYRRRKDRTVSVTFTTQEILDIGPIDQMATNESAGILYFRADETMSINRQEIEELDALELDLYDQPKPQSKRLRAVLYRVWEQHHQHQVPEFRDYYKAETERIIQHYKDKLD